MKLEIHIVVSWAVTPCSDTGADKRLGGETYIHLKDEGECEESDHSK
jgi:hypothetical protein